MTSPSSENPRESDSLFRTLAATFSGVLFGMLMSKLHAASRSATNAAHRVERIEKPAEQTIVDPAKAVTASELENTRVVIPCRFETKQPKVWWKTWKPYAFLVNLATLIVVFCYTLEAYKANSIAHQNLVASQRPWVGTTDVAFSAPVFYSPSPKFPVQMDMDISFSLKNSGLSPANRITVDAGIIPYDKPGFPPPIFIGCELPAKDMKRDLKNQLTFFLLPQAPIKQTISLQTNPERGGLFKQMSNIWISVCVTYEDTLQGGVHGTNYIYHGISLDAAPQNIPVPGRDFTYKNISSWNQWSSEAN